MIAETYTWPPTIELRRSRESIAAHLAAIEELAERPAPEYDTSGGDGIVYVGAGRYWPGVVVGVRLLREAGCTLPVEVWYRGSCESIDTRQVAGLGVTCLDLDLWANLLGDNRVEQGNEWFGGWEAKLYALTHTRFARVLYLDADAYCVDDPTTAIQRLSPRNPFMFWEDLPRMRGCVKWDRVWPGGDTSCPPIQGGQLLIDRRGGAKVLEIAHWICQHSDFYFAHIYGDQDAWRVAAAATDTPWLNLGEAPWRGDAFVLPFACRPLIVHRCQSKLFTGNPPQENPDLPKESLVFAHFLALIG
jgi:hypothetical protein